MKADWLTIGVEEEYQIVDAEGELKPHITTLMGEPGEALGDHVTPATYHSLVEAAAGLRATVARVLSESGLGMPCAGTHPFSKWQEQLITESDRYKMLEDEMQDVVRSILIFRLPVHVAIPDRERGTEVMNEARYFLPHLLALSTSSPFWSR